MYKVWVQKARSYSCKGKARFITCREQYGAGLYRARLGFCIYAIKGQLWAGTTGTHPVISVTQSLCIL
jgi:hypothetical protein